MREIKFRAWDSINSEMVYPRYEPFNSLTVGDILKRYENVMQFTGLTDKNGVEIYEHDIVNMQYDESIDRPHVIVWKNTSTKFIAIHMSEYEMFKSGMRDIYFLNTGKTPNSFSATVIGNLHQHPNLLTK